MSDKVIIQRWITEDTNGKRQNADSPTGWERRTGKKIEGFEPEFAYRRRGGERVLVDTGLFKRVSVDEWAPCEGPRTVKYEDKEAEGIRGGSVTAEVTWPDRVPEEARQIHFVGPDDSSVGLDYEDYKIIVEALITKRGLAEFRLGNDNRDPEEVKARVAKIQAARGDIDSLMERLGVDVKTLQQYDRF